MYEENYETLSSYENDQESGEQAAEILYAIHDTDPATGEEFWYTKSADGEKIPLDVKEDEMGVLREVLDDGTLGREVVQDPADDPERVKNLYGSFGEGDPDSSISTAEQTLPADQKNTPQPIALSTETLPDSDPLGSNQANANAVATTTRKINEEIAESNPESSLDSGNPAEFSEETSAYHEKLASNLDDIVASLMQKADALSGLNMPDAARLFAHRVEIVHANIKNEIDVAGSDYQALIDIHRRFFEGEASTVITKIDPELAANSSTIKFDELLSRSTTIPELTHLADRLVASRHALKAEKLAQQD